VSRLSDAQRRAVVELLRIAPVAEDLGARFAAAGHTLALVGGSVRDALLGRLGRDLDFATDARPDAVARLLRGWSDAQWETGIAFGTVGARKDDFLVEITTYRADVYDRASRRPRVTYGQTLQDDLARRDFTINAMALELAGSAGSAGSGETGPRFVDPYGGLDDLTDQLLRTPGRPEDSFADDPLRMMRAARFASQLGFVPASDVVAAMTDMAGRIAIISAERIRDELVKTVLSPAPRTGLTLLVDTGLAEHVLPELPRLRLEIDEHHRHKDVYEHSLTVLEQAIALEHRLGGAPDLVLRLAALLHDIGKPKTRRFEPGGGVSFHHHEVVGANLATARLKALRFDRHTVEDVARLIELHLRFHGYGTGEWTDSAVRRYVRDAGPHLERLHLLTRSDSTTRNRRKALALSRAYDELEARIAKLAEQEELARVRPDLDGSAIMAVLGIPPGPLVGRAYRHLLELRLDRGPMERTDAEQELQRWWKDQPESGGSGSP
jgi:poly(A) polymerase